ncbi:MAG: hypothetical protein FWD11_07145, partial [Micrococcales bacterium]|nr:hypothetical protein [Micrococcales bacterium]
MKSAVLVSALGLVLGLAACTQNTDNNNRSDAPPDFDVQSPDAPSSDEPDTTAYEKTDIPLPSWVDASGPVVLKTYYSEDLDVHFSYPATADLEMTCKSPKMVGECTYTDAKGTSYNAPSGDLMLQVIAREQRKYCDIDPASGWEILADVPGLQGHNDKGAVSKAQVAELQRSSGVRFVLMT